MNPRSRFWIRLGAVYGITLKSRFIVLRGVFINIWIGGAPEHQAECTSSNSASQDDLTEYHPLPFLKKRQKLSTQIGVL